MIVKGIANDQLIDVIAIVAESLGHKPRSWRRKSDGCRGIEFPSLRLSVKQEQIGGSSGVISPSQFEVWDFASDVVSRWLSVSDVIKMIAA
jgi:hypothetical protein